MEISPTVKRQKKVIIIKKHVKNNEILKNFCKLQNQTKLKSKKK